MLRRGSGRGLNTLGLGLDVVLTHASALPPVSSLLMIDNTPVQDRARMSDRNPCPALRCSASQLTTDNWQCED